ncbi:hypothetical protein J8L88_16885 [Aquimarina sp. MMG015]|uniref:DUF6794 domain-containing protein n=1 Tax=Aquimarina sp. MMG015 TaxID=2822689 RepID=UPI001B3A3892|nr:DUF6794 domain-containing protein [Aquimarina sp. MMG015]MBQ4804539.1 hypothetical protein [Aquimarina sp. MMG015]
MKNKILLFLLLLPTLLIGQNNCNKYIKNYIPTDLSDAIAYFECKTPEKILKEFENKEETEATSGLHFSTGMSIRNNWNLWSGTSKISKHFRELGIHHPDDMSGIILTSLHRKLNGKSIELDKQIKYYQNYWAESERKETESKIEEFSEFEIGNIVEFLYDYDFISKKQEKKYEEDKCIAHGIVTELNKEKFEIKVKLKESCDKQGIIILEYDVWDQINGEYQKIEEDKIEIMKKGENKWCSYELWEVVEK